MNVLFFCLVLAAPVAGLCESEEPDHPLIKRFPGSQMKNKRVTDFVDTKVIATCSGHKDFTTLDLQGTQTQIGYFGPEGKGHSEVYVNYLQALKRAGFQILSEPPKGKPTSWQCRNRIMDFQYPAHFIDIKGPDIKMVIAKKQGTYVQVLTGENKKGLAQTYLYILEQKSVATDQVKVNAEALAQEIEQSGHASVYGILFDTDSDVIKPESKPALDEISKLLMIRPKLRLYIVGHSDMTGEIKHNMDLSRRRAAAVARNLVDSYKIAANRLQGYGVGPLAPAGSNRNEEGRSKNRRVELIEIVK